MAERPLPVRPNIDQLRNQAKDLLKAVRNYDPAAIAEFRELHPKPDSHIAAKLADAQLVIARSYGLPSWPRLVTAARMTDAIWRGDIEGVRAIIIDNPKLVFEQANGRPSSNWGPPMSYAANVGQSAIVEMLRDMGATDIQHAFNRACLQGKLDTARRLHAMGGRPLAGAMMEPCETLSGTGLEFLLELGAELVDGDGDPLAPIGLLLQTYSRNPEGKRACFDIVAARSVILPDTVPMAVHRGRIDLLEALLARDRAMLTRTFTHDEIYPRALGCHEDPTYALHGTPLAGGTLLHMAVDFDETEIVQWLLEKGMNVDAPAAIDADGFGGHTALFGTVVSQPFRCGRQKDGAMARLLLDAGADTNARGSLRKALRFVADETLHEYRDVSLLGWGERFHDQDWVNRAAMRLIAERGGSVAAAGIVETSMEEG